MKKYFHIFIITCRNELAYLKAFIVRNIFFIIILFIFYSLWKVIFAKHAVISGFTMVQTLWYLTFTETVEMSRINLISEIQNEIKDGTIAYSISKPYSYLFFKISQAFGQGFTKIFPFLILSFIFSSIFVGVLPGYFKALPLGLVLLTGALVLRIMWFVLIGILAFWTEEVTPFFWIYQKLVFMIGGLFIPLDFYPQWLQAFSKYTPFAFSAYWPGVTMVKFSREAFIIGITGQVFYILILWLVCQWLFNAATRRLHVQGG